MSGAPGYEPLGESAAAAHAEPRAASTLTARVAFVIVGFYVFLAIFGPLLAPLPQDAIVTNESFAAPGEVGWLGSDYLGRDLFSRLLYGGRMTIGLGLVAVLLAFAVGITLGFTAAAAGGWVDNVLSRVNDAAMSFPSILLALIVIASLGTSIPVLIVTVGLIEATSVFRLSRALGMDMAAMDFVDVARARGENLSWIIRREIFPNTIGPLAAEFGLRFTFSILFISTLSFLGLGVQPPLADWGSMVRENMSGLLFGSMAALIPAAAIALLTIGVNLLVDSMFALSNRDISEEMTR